MLYEAVRCLENRGLANEQFAHSDITVFGTMNRTDAVRGEHAR